MLFIIMHELNCINPAHTIRYKMVSGRVAIVHYNHTKLHTHGMNMELFIKSVEYSQKNAILPNVHNYMSFIVVQRWRH